MYTSFRPNRIWSGAKFGNGWQFCRGMIQHPNQNPIPEIQPPSIVSGRRNSPITGVRFPLQIYAPESGQPRYSPLNAAEHFRPAALDNLRTAFPGQHTAKQTKTSCREGLKRSIGRRMVGKGTACRRAVPDGDRGQMYSRGQSELQSAVCREAPTQSSPPLSGGGLSQERCLSIRPEPHWGSQSDQPPQPDQPPSTVTQTVTGAHSLTSHRPL